MHVAIRRTLVSYCSARTPVERPPFNAPSLSGTALLVPVQGHPLTASAEFPFGAGGDGSRALAESGAFLKCEQLFGTERFVVDLRSGLNKVLEVSASQEVTEVDEFAVVLVLDCSRVVS